MGIHSLLCGKTPDNYHDRLELMLQLNLELWLQLELKL